MGREEREKMKKNKKKICLPLVFFTQKKKKLKEITKLKSYFEM